MEHDKLSLILENLEGIQQTLRHQSDLLIATQNQQDEQRSLLRMLSEDHTLLISSLQSYASEQCTKLEQIKSQSTGAIKCKSYFNNASEHYPTPCSPAEDTTKTDDIVSIPDGDVRPDEVDDIKDTNVRRAFGFFGDNSQESSWLKRIIVSDRFEMLFGMVILFNSVLMAVQIQVQGSEISDGLSRGVVSNSSTVIFDQLDSCFLILFAIEIGLRTYALGSSFWKSPTYLLDAAVVLIGVLASLHLLSIIDPTILRILRLAKFARYARMLRTAHLLHVLRLILKATAGSISTVFWSLALITGIQCVTGMLIWQLVLNYTTDASKPIGMRREIDLYWGTFSRVMITMFEVSFNNHEKFTRVLTENISEAYGWFFMVYRLAVNFVLLSVVRAVLVKQTFRVAENDPELSLAESMRNQQIQLRTLQDIFAEFDRSGDGFVDHDEFSNMLSHGWVRQWLQNMGVKITCSEDATLIWEILNDDGTGKINSFGFLQGLSKISGSAQSLDQSKMMRQVTKICRTCTCMEEHLTCTADKHTEFLSFWSLHFDRLSMFSL